MRTGPWKIRRRNGGIDGNDALLDDTAALQDEWITVEPALEDGGALWNLIYPHMTESGPHLNLADCEEIVRWMKAGAR